MVKKILSIVVILAALLSIVVSMQPSEFHVTRSITVNGAPEAPFNLVNNLKQWDAWSPWAKVDPNAKMSFSGPEQGPGASFTWSGNHEVGEGTLTLKEAVPYQRIRYELEFIKPFPGVSASEFSFTPQGTSTLITWSMWGKNNFVAKAMGLIIDCDKMIGDQFEKGLQSIKSLAEK